MKPLIRQFFLQSLSVELPNPQFLAVHFVPYTASDAVVLTAKWLSQNAARAVLTLFIPRIVVGYIKPQRPAGSHNAGEFAQGLLGFANMNDDAPRKDIFKRGIS